MYLKSEEDVKNLIQKQPATAATAAGQENKLVAGIRVNPIAFEKILNDAPVVNQVGEPEELKPVSASKVDGDDQS
ncbi:hypothetical protein ACFFJY_07900 [Fictibacillus aquaticus]|uniref:hypothetical protein n=1 Tax=Fictibacillus aquaticus TaxID=2021314 RepID=UPI0010567346|nr:hypothetical protein [Fictibacillus aquaticus]